MDMELNDVNSLIAEALRNPDAFAEIYDRYFSRIYNYIRFRVNDQNATDDLTSQVFEKLTNKLHTYRPDRGGFDGWLFRIAHNVIVDYFRSRRRVAYLEEIPALPANEPGLDENLIVDEINKTIMQALTKLDEREQNVITLKFWGGISNRQIARITGLSYNNVGVIVYRSLKKLKMILQDQGMFNYE